MGSVREQLTNMFSKVMAGTVTREEGTMLINHLVRENMAETVKELSFLIDNPPPGVFPKTILHTIALSRNKAFFNIMIASLEHKNEDVSILAAQELAKLKTSDAKEVLAEHLDSEVYHVRKASALALAQGFSDGPEILKEHMLTHSEPYFRLTSAQALLGSGRKGVEALLSILNSGNAGAMSTAAEVLINGSGELQDRDIPSVFDALMLAGDRKETQSIIEILKVAGALKSRAKGFEGFVMAFADHPFEPVKKEAQRSLKAIRG